MPRSKNLFSQQKPRVIRSFDDLPYHKRPGSRQIEKASKVIKSKESIDYELLGAHRSRSYVGTGIHKAGDLPSVVKKIRIDNRKVQAYLLKDAETGEPIGRTFFTSPSDLSESLIIKMLAKYGFNDNDDVELDVIFFDDKAKPAKKTKPAKAKPAKAKPAKAKPAKAKPAKAKRDSNGRWRDTKGRFVKSPYKRK